MFFVLLLDVLAVEGSQFGFERFISKYEIANIDISFLNTETETYEKRGINTPKHEAIRVRFRSFGNDVDFIASKSLDPESFRTRLEIHGSRNPKHMSVRDFRPNFYEISSNKIAALGFLMDDGSFTGVVSYPKRTYYIEPLHMHFRNATSKLKLLVYRDIDIKFPSMSNDVVDPKIFGPSGQKSKHVNNRATDLYGNVEKKFRRNRKYRNLTHYQSSVKGQSSACEIEMISDVSLFKHFKGDNNTVASYLSILGKHADEVFRKTPMGPKTIRIVVKNIIIYVNESEKAYPVWENTTDIHDYLEKFAEFDSNYCLSVSISGRQFNTTSVSKAYNAFPDDESKSLGGVCSYPKLTAEGKKETLNKAALTIIDNGGKLALLGSTLHTFVHELGHAFGSDHDPLNNPICSPGGSLQYYIMHEFPRESGPLINKFSSCSVSAMTRTIKTRTCFKPIAPVCGNGIREGEEDCDCGYTSTCQSVDQCCTPSEGLGGNEGCTYRQDLNFTCSYREDPCCSDMCVYEIFPKECSREADGCLVGTCDGQSKDCPRPKALPDGTPCKGSSRTCLNGTCSSSACGDNNLRDCNCPESCQVCCWKENLCVTAFSLGFTGGDTLFLDVGEVCGRGKQCDINGVCIYTGKTNAMLNTATYPSPDVNTTRPQTYPPPSQTYTMFETDLPSLETELPEVATNSAVNPNASIIYIGITVLLLIPIFIILWYFWRNEAFVRLRGYKYRKLIPTRSPHKRASKRHNHRRKSSIF